VPVKPGIDANKLAARAEEYVPLHNASYLEFKARLEKEGVRVFDPSALMIQRKTAVCFALGWLALVVLATQEYNPFIYFIF
jgi:hypothetical protein